MSQQPLQPLAYYPYRPRGRVPISVRVVAIVGLIMGGLWTFSILNGLIMFGSRFMDFRFHSSSAFVVTIYWTSVMVGDLMLVALLIGSIACMMLKPVGRVLLIIYAIVNLAVDAIALAVNLAVFWLPRLRALRALLGGTMRTREPIFWILSFGYVAFIVVWKIIVLRVMTRPHVKAAFAGLLTDVAVPPQGYAYQPPFPPLGPV